MTAEMTMTGLRTTLITAMQATRADCAQPDEPHAVEAAAAEVSTEIAPALSEPSVASVLANADSWRDEVAARLERYRTRRKPRSPRYPSLLLPFDAPESWSRSAPHAQGGSAGVATARADHDIAFHSNSGLANPEPAENIYSSAEPNSNDYPEHVSEHRSEHHSELPELSAKVIEFPRSAAIPIVHRSELADPIFDRPRIVEAPEILPPPPALGGMLMEPARQESAERRPEPLFVSPPASIPRRVLAAVVDGALLVTALAAVTAIFLRWNAAWIPGLNTTITLSRDLLYGPLPNSGRRARSNRHLALDCLRIPICGLYRLDPRTTRCSLAASRIRWLRAQSTHASLACAGLIPLGVFRRARLSLELCG